MTAPLVRDYTPYVKRAREQAARRRKEAAARLDRAWAVARQIAEFRSLMHPEMFGLHSDIDIAVDGIPWPDYLRAWNAVEEKFPEFKVDLIDVGIVSERMRKRIEAEGQPL